MKRYSAFVLIVCALGMCLVAGEAVAQQSPRMSIGGGRANGNANGNENDLSFNFDNAPILEVIDIMSRVTGKNFIIDPTVKGTVTVIAPTRVPKEEAYGVFESILEMNGFSLVPVGSIIKVVPSRSATQKSIPVITGRESKPIHERDQVVTQLIPIRHTDAQSIVTALTPLVSRDANITTYANTNTIIITETSSNIKRLLNIVQEIDVPGFEETITIVQVRNAQADVLAQEILQALEPASGGAQPASPTVRTRRRTPNQPAASATTTSRIKIIPDARTNSLIIVANELDTEQVRFLIDELDKATPIEANNIHVHRLQNALAEEVAAVLTSLAATTTPATSAGGAAAPVAATRTFYKEVSIVADKTTNSLIITATPQDYLVLKEVIDQLDIMRPQVLVETLIAEVSLDFTRSLGVRWQAASGGGSDRGFVTVNEATDDSIAAGVGSALGAADGLDTNLVNLIPGLTPGGVSIGYLNISGDVLRGFVELNASEGNTDFNVLSAPHVLTLDNERAIINISDNVPFITQRLSDTGGTTALATSETFEYRDVGIILEITPHISPDRLVRLEIVQKVNDVSVVASGISEGALSEIKREAETTVMVKDRHTLVLGGLMKDSDNITINKVPFLGDIPVLGWAFKNKSTTRTKTNLLIFITPSIVADVDEATAVTTTKSDEVSDRLRERMKEAPVMRRKRSFDDDIPPSEEAQPSEEVQPGTEAQPEKEAEPEKEVPPVDDTQALEEIAPKEVSE